MKHLFFSLFTLFVALLLAVSAALLIGHGQSAPQQAGLLHLGDMCALPCWIGIIPGKTHVSEARLIIAKVYNQGNSLLFDTLHGATSITRPDGLRFWVSLNDWYPGGFPEDTNRVVSRITLGLYPGEGELLLGDVIEALGPPDGVELGYACCAGVALVKQWFRVSLPDATTDALQPRHIYVSQPANFISLGAATDSRYDMHWRGFGSYQMVFPSQKP